MKCVAVIPARINTKRVPNKMLRIVGNHPLVYYAIENAKKSTYISDIVVTTDSEQISLIAKQLGVKCIMRDEHICGDDVPLDIVVYNAVQNLDADVVVTMQPTSPLLKVKTLDCALSYFFENQYDSVVSVHNDPKLSWEKGENSCVPKYEKRLNSQYLPPHYVETGAFLISKKEVITKNSRFGEKVGIWETSLTESVSVCEWQDLALVDMLLNCKKVAFYVNGNVNRGMGHIYRVLELADEFYVRPDIYYDKNQTDVSAFGDTLYDVIGIRNQDELGSVLANEGYDILVNDILNTTEEYIAQIRELNPKMKIVNFEDLGDGARLADLVINALYSDVAIGNMKCGAKYYIAPKSFLYYEPINIKDKVQNVLISFGGADPMDYTSRVLELLTKDIQKYHEIHFVVVVGRANKHFDEIKTYDQFENIEVLYDICNMPDIMSQCDVAISSRGRTGYELALLGVPTLVLAQNKQETTHDFISLENGFDYIGIQPESEVLLFHMDQLLFSSSEKRNMLQTKMLTNDLRNGRNRVIHLIKSI